MATSSTASVFAKLYAAIKQDQPTTLFFVARGCDDKLIVYDAMRIGDKLVNNGVDVYVGYASNSTRDTIPNVLNTFFGTSKVKQVKHGLYRTAISAIPERPIDIILKKSGAVSASARIAGVDNVHIYAIYQDLTFNALDIPDLHSLTIYGIHPQTKAIVTETIKVTDDMKRNIDPAALFKAYMGGK